MFEDQTQTSSDIPANVPSKYAFAYKLSQTLGAQPEYYQLLVADEPSRKMWDLVESLALDGDPEEPGTALQLFQDLSEGVPQDQADRWLSGLRDAARNIYRNTNSAADTSMAERMMRIIYSDPNLYELVASVEPGYGLVELVESLALEGDAGDVDTMLRLMRDCAVE